MIRTVSEIIDLAERRHAETPKPEPALTREEFEILQQQLATTQKSLIRAHQDIVEIKADLAAAGIPKGGKSSKLILPDRMN